MDEMLIFKDVLICGICLIAIIWVTRRYNMWGSATGSKKAKEEKITDNKIYKRKKRMTWLMRQMDGFCKSVGGGLSAKARYDWDFRISRKNLKVPVLDRDFKATELVGCIRMLMFIAIGIGIGGFLVSQNIIFGAFVLVGVIIPIAVKYLLDSAIADDDLELERDFPDLYLLLYTRLSKGAEARLAPTLADYYQNMIDLYDNDEHRVMKNFLQDFRNAIDLYADETLAIPKIREKYKSATVVNFCNLALQSLRGVDNKDKLLAFKLELSNKRRQEMKERAEKLVEKGNRAIMLIFVVLFQFIVIGWSAKFQFSMPALF